MHQQGKIPDSFVGAAFDTASVLGSLEDTILAAVWCQEPHFKEAENRGQLGEQAPIVTWITLVRGDESLRVQALGDGGSESSYYNPDIQEFAISTKKKSFRLETLSCSATNPEDVHGVEAQFHILTAAGQKMNINILRHEGLANRHLWKDFRPET